MTTIYDPNGTAVLRVTVDDNSYRHREIMGENALTLYFALAEHVEIPVGAYTVFEGETYTLMRPEALKMQHTRNFEYTVTMESAQAKAKTWKFRNPVDGRLKFSLTARPHEHLQMFVDNMNRRDTGWTAGGCIEGAEQCVTYSHAYCWDALGQMADEFGTEFEINGKTVSLRKAEYNKDNPLPLSYGRGNGFKPGIGRSNYGDKPPIEILYPQGGTRNIDRGKYGASELHLPVDGEISYDGQRFEDEDGFDASGARRYVADSQGYFVKRGDKALTSQAEDSLDCSEIYPKRVGTVSEVIIEDAGKNFYDFTDETIPDTLDFGECLIEGETMTVIFQSGMLAGKEFEVKYIHEAKTVNGVSKKARRFEIVPQEIDGQTMPNDTFKPAVGDEYAVFNCALPDSYVNDASTKTGAEWDMMRQCVKYLHDHEEQDFSFTGTLDGIWAKKDWANIGGRIVLGGYVLFTDERFQQEGVKIRIIGIKDYVNNPHSPELELSNSTVTGSFGTTLSRLESTEVLIDESKEAAVSFTKRRFRDAKETMDMLEQAMLDNFTEKISPIAIQTMQMLVGDESLQFRFVTNTTDQIADTGFQIVWDNVQKQLSTSKATCLQHMTLGISGLSSSHEAGEYKYWQMSRYTSAHLYDADNKYYLYAKCDKDGTTGEFVLSETAKAMDPGDGYYYFLAGILNSEYEGERSFVTLYGFTEILPGRVTTDRVVSSDGQSYFDMVANAMKLGDKFSFTKDSNGNYVLKLKGTIVQNTGGNEELLGVYRGVYDGNVTYYSGDSVTYTDPTTNTTSLYKNVSSSAIKGIAPTNTNYWKVQAQGSKGASSFKSTVFIRQNSQPDTPTGGSYTSPVPTTGGWSDGIPAGEAILWASTRIFSSDGASPQQGAWSTPAQMTDTADFDVEYSSVETSPGNPTDNPSNWTGSASTSTVWMATRTKSNGEWSGWEVCKVKGENGVGISTVTEWYLASPAASGVTVNTSGWSKTVPTIDATNKYLWNYEEITYDKTGKAATTTTPAVIGTYSKDGKGIVSITEYYLASASDSGVTTSTSGWSTTMQYPSESKKYLWNYEKITFTEGDPQTTTPAVIGTYSKDGADGAYYEYRYAVNGSTSSAPSLSSGSTSPSGWTTSMPSVGTSQYLWMTVAKKSADGTLLQGWSTPVRTTPYDGVDGAKGDKGDSPAMVYRGVYDSSKTYYGNANRLDCVKYDDTWYIARIDAGTFSGEIPPSTSYWNPFGASFESVATSLLLADMANIANLIFKDGMLISQDGTVDGEYSTDYANENFVPNIVIDGTAGVIRSSNGARFDTKGVSLYGQSGNVLCRLTSGTIGDAADLNDKSFSGERSITDSQQLYAPSRLVTHEQTVGYMSYDIGLLTAGDTVKITSGNLSCTLPYHVTDGETITFLTATLYISLLCDGKTVYTASEPSYSSLSSGSKASLSLTPGATFNITEDGEYQEGRYSVEIYLVLRYYTSASGQSKEFSITGALSYSYAKTNIEKTLIGSDGMYSCWGEKKYLYTSANGIFMRQDKYMLEITSGSGIRYSTDGGSNYKSLT